MKTTAMHPTIAGYTRSAPSGGNEVMSVVVRTARIISPCATVYRL